MIFILFATFFAFSNASHVKKIDVLTANCEDCGMSILGQLSVKLCGNGPGQCCVAENLDNLLLNDFNEGEVSSFTGSTLGECNGFDLGEKDNWDRFMTLYHSGPDGGQFDHVTVYKDDSINVRCKFSKFLDSGDFEVGQECGPL